MTTNQGVDVGLDPQFIGKGSGSIRKGHHHPGQQQTAVAWLGEPLGQGKADVKTRLLDGLSSLLVQAPVGKAETPWAKAFLSHPGRSLLNLSFLA